MRETIAWTIAKKVLEDGLWHDYKQVIYQISKEIPPNVAIHWSDLVRKRYLKSTKGEDAVNTPRFKYDTLEYRKLFGSRDLARRALQMNLRIEHGRTPDKTKYVRLRTQFVEPPPSNVEEVETFLVNPSKGTPFSQLPIEDQRRLQNERRERLKLAWYKTHGIDPATHVTHPELVRRKRAEWDALSEEEKAKIRSDKSRRAAETRRRNLEAAKRKEEEENG